MGGGFRGEIPEKMEENLTETSRRPRAKKPIFRETPKMGGAVREKKSPKKTPVVWTTPNSQWEGLAGNYKFLGCFGKLVSGLKGEDA